MFTILAVSKITSWFAIGIALLSTCLTSDILLKKYNRQVKFVAGGTAIGCTILTIIGILLLL